MSITDKIDALLEQSDYIPRRNDLIELRSPKMGVNSRGKIELLSWFCVVGFVMNDGRPFWFEAGVRRPPKMTDVKYVTGGMGKTKEEAYNSLDYTSLRLADLKNPKKVIDKSLY